MKQLLIATVAWLAVTATSTFAADLYSPASTPAPIYTKAPPPPGYSWTGWYVGLDAGGAWAHSSDPTTTVFDPAGYFAATSVPAVDAAGAQSNNPAGFIGGAEAGGNVQWNMFVTGVEADFNYLGLRKSTSSSGAYPCCGPTTGFIVNSSISTSWLATVRGRLGVANNGWLFYATGGAAFTDFKASFGFTDLCGTYLACGGFGYPPGFEAASISNIKAGYAVGGGVETHLSGNWTLKAEYLYVGFGNVTTQGFLTGATQIAFGSNLNPFTHSANLSANIFRLGLNYKLY
jgi:outer membrane immunogenic protein